MNAYQKAKERARDMAIDFSNAFGQMDLSWAEIAYYGYKFERLGRRYGLLREFRENGFC